MQERRRVLWVDDDGQERFLYELSILQDNGMDCEWAHDAEEAMERLSRSGYDLVLLDQVFPIGRTSWYTDVWSGCRLLYWLRGQQPPSGAPQGALWAEGLKKNQPLFGNMSVPVIVISGFQDDDVDRALRQVNPEISTFPKPVDGDLLIATIKRLLARD